MDRLLIDERFQHKGYGKAAMQLLLEQLKVEYGDQPVYLSVVPGNDTARKLIARFTPGPLTVIVPKKQCIGKVVSAGMETVGLRFPSNRICMELIRIAGVPIAAPSANISSFPPPTTGTQTIENLNGRVDAIIDGGATAVGIESTIISLVGKPVILRHGAVSDDEIAEALGI